MEFPKYSDIYITTVKLQGVQVGNMSKRLRADIASLPGLQSDSEESQLPETYVVMKVVPDIHEKALQWLFTKIRGKKTEGGGELVAILQPKTEPNEVRAIQVKLG